MAFVSRTHVLRYKAGSTEYSVPYLVSREVIDHNGWRGLGMTFGDGETWYLPMVSGSAGNGHRIHANIGGTVFRAYDDVLPYIRVTWTDSREITQGPYKPWTYWTRTVNSISVSIPLSVDLDVYVSANSGGGWVHVGTLTAGSWSRTINAGATAQSADKGSDWSSRYVAPSPGQFRIMVKTKIQLRSLGGTVRWHANSSGVTNHITAYVTLDSPLVRGYIDFKGEWWALFPPFYTEGTSVALSSGSSSGETMRLFVSGAGAGACCKLIYKGSGLGDRTIAERGFEIVTPIWGDWTDRFSFEQTVGGDTVLFTDTTGFLASESAAAAARTRSYAVSRDYS